MKEEFSTCITEQMELPLCRRRKVVADYRVRGHLFQRRSRASEAHGKGDRANEVDGPEVTG